MNEAERDVWIGLIEAIQEINKTLKEIKAVFENW